MYTDRNFKTKKALKEAVAARVAHLEAPDSVPYAPAVGYYQPGPFGGNEPQNGKFCCEGPHYPQPHKWYAECESRNGEIVKVK